MSAPIAKDIRPITTPNLDLDHLPMDDKDFQIKDTTTLEPLLKVHCQCRDRYLNHADEIGPWESNFPKYQFPQVHILLDIVHMCYTCYISSQRTIMYHD